ncbi:Metalloprotease [Desarmillaria ectypa]|nr:Metalloprotease [Desarmillaria ectypa]
MADTVEETAPLLQDPDVEDGESAQVFQHRPSFGERITSVVQEPLTPLTKVLLVVVLILLLLSSIFIGLFTGVQHKLNTGQGGSHDGDKPTETYTLTATTTSHATKTVLPPPEPTVQPPEPLCLTPQCVILSASILSSLDTSQNPCENFYEFSSGRWLKEHPLPADKSSFGNFEALAVQNKQILQKILEAPQPTSAVPTADEQLLIKIRGMYASCLNETKLDEIGTEPLVHLVRTVRKLFRGNSTDISSATEEERTSKKGLTAAIAFLHSRGIEALFSFNVEGDVGVDPNFMTLWFNQPSFGLPSKEYYTEESIREAYQNVIERLLLTLVEEEESLRSKFKSDSSPLTNQAESVWPPWPWPPWGEDDDDKDGGKQPVNQTERAHELAKKVVKFETRIANASLDLDILQEDPVATYNPVPLSNLTTTLPQIRFSDYFSTFTPRNFPNNVILTYPPYAESLSEILDDSPADVIETYLVAQTALSLSPYLGMGTEAWQAQRSLLETLSGIKKGAVGDRAEYCVGQAESTLGFATGRYFVNETFGGESKEKGTKLITDIVEAFKQSLSHVDWMDKKSAKAASNKADAIRVKVGFPISPDTRSAESIANYYRLVEIDENKFFQNILSATTSEKVKEWFQLGKNRDPEAWEMFPSTVNAYFNPPANEIVFPAGILQPPFFSKDWPGYLAYGAFGHVAAHELTHAFDSAGRMYNQEGKLEQWWTNSTSDGFQVKQDCIVKQYSAYTIDDGKGGKVHVNGNLTSGENIGDTGLIQAYRAWRAQFETSRAKGNEYLLPGLNFTREQLFFISFGRIWARSMKPAAALQRIRTDPHSPSQYRVDGTVFNIPEFAEAFKCPKTAKLNPPPEKQCRFW